MFNIKQVIANYSQNNRTPFNEELFIRSEYDIIDDILKVIYSVAAPYSDNREGKQVFIGINYTKIIDDYREVKKILYELENGKNRKNKRIDYNIHDYINLKDSDIILLEVNYHVEVAENKVDGSVFIDIPKVINKYYFKISGTIYSTLYQIADASTYNNNGKKKSRSVSFRQEFQKHVVYEKKCTIDMLKYNDDGSTEEITVSAINYTTDLFGVNISVCKYFLAKFGIAKTISYLRLYEVYITEDKPYKPNDQFIVFTKNNIYVSVPFMIWDNSPVTQSFIYTIITNISLKKCIELDRFFAVEYWLTVLGMDFKNKSIEKGHAMLDSTERNYSLIMKESLKLPNQDKETLLDVLRWEIYEFDALYNKDNYDMSFKKLRMSSYIAGFYAAKLTKNLISAINGINNINIDKVFKALKINHEFILDSLKRSNLVSYKNNTNDDDIFSVLKYTFKGSSGIGENKASAVPMKYRLANPSHIGRVDCDTSPAGDPGMTGLICPYAELYDGMYLSDYKEPDNWREVQDKLIDEYRKVYSTASIFKTKEELLGTSYGREMINDILSKINNLVPFTIGNDIEIQ